MKVSEVVIDNKDGWGQVPNNQNVDYMGLRVKMRPSIFKKLASPLGGPPSDAITNHIAKGGSIGAPFLDIRVPKNLEDYATVIGHEGRNRMEAILQLEGDAPIEVHLFFRGEVDRNRHITKEVNNYLNTSLYAENTLLIKGPFWETDVSEEAAGVGRITKQNTTVDVKPGETRRQSKKFGNKLNKKNEPPLLDTEARKNSSPHVLSNLGLAESTNQRPMIGYKIMQYDPETQTVISGADSRTTKNIKLKKGLVMKMPHPGIFLSTDKKYVQQYYGDIHDHEALIAFEFDPSTITSGNLTDKENEFTVPTAKVIGAQITDNVEESTQMEAKNKSETYELELIRSPSGDVLKVKSNRHPSWIEIRGKTNYETAEYDPNDPLHKFLDKLDPPTVAALMAGDVKFLNPNNPRTTPSIDMARDIMTNEAIQKPRPEDTLGVKRSEMPQVHQKHYPELLKYLAAKGGKFATKEVDPDELKPTQSEFSDKGVEKMMKKSGVTSDGSRKPLIVSSDNYIIDGHHRWLANLNLGKTLPVMQVSIPIRRLLQLVRNFKHTTYKTIYERGKVVEVFDSQYPYEWTRSGSSNDQWIGEFKVDDGSTVEFSANPSEMVYFIQDLYANGVPIDKLPTHDDEDIVWDIMFRRNKKLKVTGGGDQQKIFSTVIKMTDEFFRRANPERISFSASKKKQGIVGSRAKLYSRLAKMLARSTNYKLKIFDAGTDAQYYLYDPALGESKFKLNALINN